MTPTHPAVQSARRLETARHLEVLRRRDPLLRSRHVGTRAWALAHAVPVDGEALTVVLAVLGADEAEHGTAPTSWTTDRVVEFVWRACPLWGLRNDIVVPRSTTEALRAWWARLADDEAFAPGSDPLDALEHTLAAHTGRAGSPAVAQHPSMTARVAGRVPSRQRNRRR